MATVTAFVRVSTKNKAKANVRFRLRDGRTIQLFHKSELEIDPALWDNKTQAIKVKVLYNAISRATINKSVNDRKDLILRLYNAQSLKDALTSEWLELQIDKELNPDKYADDNKNELSFFEAFDLFLTGRKISEVRKKNFRVVVRALQRYEIYQKSILREDFKLNFDNITPDELRKFEAFLHNEHIFHEQYPELYEAVPETRTPQPRGQNTINGIFGKIRTLFLWAIDQGLTTNNPFLRLSIPESVYGTPYYITIEERNQLYNTDLSAHRETLAIQRDIFVFQCLIGCRVSDLFRLTQSNIINGAVEYIPRKTSEGRPVTVRVPLNETAKAIIERYKDDKRKPLFPFISEQKYNVAIKDMFAASGLTRSVTVRNPTTGEPDIRPLNEIASSHLARRCFIGNLYKKVKDPNLVGSLSGHKEGSKAFARYREIDEQIKQELVDMLE